MISYSDKRAVLDMTISEIEKKNEAIDGFESALCTWLGDVYRSIKEDIARLEGLEK